MAIHQPDPGGNYRADRCRSDVIKIDQANRRYVFFYSSKVDPEIIAIIVAVARVIIEQEDV
ncbi:hypothetical protein OA77_25155 [Pseudomonas coronafaciens]|nr:hypothetical protein OA77_25155 [Pseudomonas coronafaciens]